MKPAPSTEEIDVIAQFAHEVNRAYCAAIGDTSHVAWADAPDWQKESCRAGIRAHAARSLTPEESHEAWMKLKAADGWKWGAVKDAEKKEHPCFLPYAELPEKERVKDFLFRAVVTTALSIGER